MENYDAVAVFKKWNGETLKVGIKRELAESIAAAVEGQYYWCDNVNNFAINGADFAHVDIYEV